MNLPDQDHSIIMGPPNNPRNLDLSANNFDPTVTSTAVQTGSRDELLNKFFDAKPFNCVDVEDLESHLHKVQKESIEKKERKNSQLPGEFSKLSILSPEEMDDKLMDEQIDFPDQYFQPSPAINRPSISSNIFGDTTADGTLIGNDDDAIEEAVFNFNTNMSESKLPEVPDIRLIEGSPVVPENPLAKHLLEDLGSSVTFGSDGDFKSIGLDLSKEIENRFNLDVVKENQDLSHFSTIDQDPEDIITLNQSAITSPVKKFLQPGNKIKIDDLFHAKSEKLGALGDSCISEMPSFGMGPTVSPPKEESGNTKNKEKNPVEDSLQGATLNEKKPAILVQDMDNLKKMLKEKLQFRPEQIERICNHNIVSQADSTGETSGVIDFLTNRKKRMKNNIGEEKCVLSAEKQMKCLLQNMPTNINVTGVIGLGSQIILPACNNTAGSFQVKIVKLKDSLNAHTLDNPVLSFKSSYLIGPNCDSPISLVACSSTSGVYKCLCQLTIICNTTGKAQSKHINIRVDIELPDISIKHNQDNFINLGLVPECCLFRKDITVTNNSLHRFPVRMTLGKCVWSSSQSGKTLRVSDKCLAFELHSKQSVTCSIEIKIPDFPTCKDPSEEIAFWDETNVQLDCPFEKEFSLGKMPIMGSIGKVALRSSKNCSPLLVPWGRTSVLPIRNCSILPLELQVRMLSDSFTVTESVTIKEKSQQGVPVTYVPKSDQEEKSKISLTVVPDGLTIQLDVMGMVCQKSQHKELTSSVSSSLPASVTHQEIELDCNKRYISFGTLALGETATEEIEFHNRWPDQSLVMTVQLVNTDVFQIDWDGQENRNEFTIEPSVPFYVTVSFTPKETAVYTGGLVFRPKSTITYMNYTIPVQGYGGAGVLSISPWKIGGNICLKSVDQNRSNAQLYITNKGQRNMFLKLRVSGSSDDVTVWPKSVRLAPENSFLAVLVSSVVPNFDETRSASLGKLRITYDDELHLRRFKKAPNKQVPLRKMKNPLLLKEHLEELPLATSFTEEDDLIIQADEARNFFNHCKQIEFNLDWKIEDTLNQAVFHMDPSASKRPVKVKSPKPRKSLTQSTDFAVLPKSISMTSDTKQELAVSNLSNCQLFIEASSKDDWLIVSPKEIMVEPNNFVLLGIEVDKSLLPPYRISQQTSVKILCENGYETISVSIDHIPPVLQASNQAFVMPDRGDSLRKAQPKTNKENQPVRDSLSFNKEISFASCQLGKDAVEKFAIGNLGQQPETVALTTDSKHFIVRDKKFTVNPGRKTLVPITFRPKTSKKSYHGTLKLERESSNLVTSIQLSGKAL